MNTSYTSNLVNRSSNGAAFSENKDRVFRASKQMLGSYGTTRVRSTSLDEFCTSHPYGFIIPKHTSPEFNIEDSVELGRDVDKDSKDLSDPILSMSGRVARAADKDKTECRKRWATLYDKGLHYRRSNSFSNADAQSLIDEASSLQSYSGSTGDDLGDKVKIFLGELAKDIMVTREWIAESRDRLFNCKSSDIFDVRSIINKGKNLRIIPVDEIEILQKIADDVESLSVNARKMLKRSSTKPTIQVINDWVKMASTSCICIPEYSDMLGLYNNCQQLCEKVNYLLLLSDVCASCKTRLVPNLLTCLFIKLHVLHEVIVVERKMFLRVKPDLIFRRLKLF